MEQQKFLETLAITARLKDTTRHCYTTKRRHESVGEHTAQMALMAYFLRDEFPEVDMDKVIRMCLIHDLGECFTGDIPTFLKTAADEGKEDDLLDKWVSALPEPYRSEMTALYAEMAARETIEAKLYKALDGLEAVIQHNDSSLDTWLPLEYELNLTYAEDRVTFSPYLTTLRAEVRRITEEKIANEKQEDAQ